MSTNEAQTVFFGRLTDYVTEGALKRLCETVGPVSTFLSFLTEIKTFLFCFSRVNLTLFPSFSYSFSTPYVYTIGIRSYHKEV